MQTYFTVDDITYVHPDVGSYSVYVRPMIQIYDQDMRLCPMMVRDNKPKGGLMDSEIDEEFLSWYWDIYGV